MTENSSKFKVDTKGTWTQLWEKDDLQNFLVWYYTNTTEDDSGKKVVTHNLAEISGRSGADKDLSWRAFDTYLPKILEQ